MNKTNIRAPAPKEDNNNWIVELQKAKELLYSSMGEYRELFNDSTLEENRTKIQRDNIDKIITDLNSRAGDVEWLSRSEGAFALIFTGLTTLLNQHNQIIQLKFQNAVMNKRLKALEDKNVNNS